MSRCLPRSGTRAASFVLVLVVVLVLERSLVITTPNRSVSGGEPLWPVFRRPREFIPITNLAETCGSRRLPGTTQRSVAFGPERKRVEKPGVYASRWVIRGSRLLQHLATGWGAGTNITGSSDTRQSGSPPDAGRSSAVTMCDPFEDEDDDEDEYDRV